MFFQHLYIRNVTVGFNRVYVRVSLSLSLSLSLSFCLLFLLFHHVPPMNAHAPDTHSGNIRFAKHDWPEKTRQVISQSLDPTGPTDSSMAIRLHSTWLSVTVFGVSTLSQQGLVGN